MALEELQGHSVITGCHKSLRATQRQIQKAECPHASLGPALADLHGANKHPGAAQMPTGRARSKRTYEN